LNTVNGFSRMSKLEKLAWLSTSVDSNLKDSVLKLDRFWQKSEEQELFDEFSENTISNFILPFGIAPNFLINNKNYSIPMVIEESSVVAAASSAAKFWLQRGGFHTRVLSTTKIGHVHFFWKSMQSVKLKRFFDFHKAAILFRLDDLTLNMEKRGGGIKSLELVNKTYELESYYQLEVKFETCDAMGANFINSVLERIGIIFKQLILTNEEFTLEERNIDINMCILSNYNDECLVEVYSECLISELGDFEDMSSKEFAYKFKQAIDIAKVDRYRAVTNNKGIFNGIDSVVLASGNDFRAIEACAHAWASKDGRYEGLSDISIEGGVFKFSMTLPLALGTVGGLTNLHPLAKECLNILGGPDAKELMQIVATVGLAQNFAAVKSLITTGIQKGHMKMHLLNILKQLNATEKEVEECREYFDEKVISFTAIRNFLNSSRITQ
jgi:hydroxymethylglutaryl-CoA reductase